MWARAEAWVEALARAAAGASGRSGTANTLGTKIKGYKKNSKFLGYVQKFVTQVGMVVKRKESMQIKAVSV